MYKETVPFVNGGSYFHFTKKRFLFVCLKYIFAQSSGEDETIPDKRQRSPMPPHFVLAQNHSKKCGGNSDGRNDSYMERLLTARRGPTARSKIFWDSPFDD